MTSSTTRAFMAKKQSTFSAQVATNLLNVLQGYTKGIRFVAVLTMLLTLGVANAWAETYSWTCSGTTVFSTSGSSLNGVTWKATTSGSSQGTGISGEKCVQIAKNTGLTLETTDFNNKNIASISIQTWGSQGNTFYLKDGNTQLKSTTIPTSYTSNGAKISFSNVGVIGTKLVFNWASATKAFNVRSITITYEDAATCTTNPTVSAGSNSSVTTTTATVSCSGGITSLGSAGCSITSYGFVYGTSSNPTISNTKVQVGTTYTTTGTAFSKELTGLTANTTYYVRPYATNGNGTAYGTQTSFKTLELPKYTVTLDAGSGTCAESVTEPNAGEGVTLPTPTLDGCDEWSFAGWKTTSAVTTETTTEPTLIAAGAYSPTSDITLYAVYQRTETTSGGGGGGVATVVDNLTHSINGQESSNTSYVEFSDKTYTSEAKYAGSTSNGNNNTITGVIQIRSSSSNTGIITTASGGKVKKVIVVWDSGTTSGRTLDVYGKNSPYDAVGNLYASDAATKGTKLGSIVCGTSTELNITEDYEYIGLRSASNAMYLTSIAITWESTTGGGSTTTTYYHSTPECNTEPSRYLTPKYRGGSSGT